MEFRGGSVGKALSSFLKNLKAMVGRNWLRNLVRCVVLGVKPWEKYGREVSLSKHNQVESTEGFVAKMYVEVVVGSAPTLHGDVSSTDRSLRRPTSKQELLGNT